MLQLPPPTRPPARVLAGLMANAGDDLVLGPMGQVFGFDGGWSA